MTMVRFLWAWLLYGHMRCEAAAKNRDGIDVMDNPFSIAFAVFGKRCRGRVVASTKVRWGMAEVNICERHALAAQAMNKGATT